MLMLVLMNAMTPSAYSSLNREEINIFSCTHGRNGDLAGLRRDILICGRKEVVKTMSFQFSVRGSQSRSHCQEAGPEGESSLP